MAYIDYIGLRSLLNFDLMNDLAPAYLKWTEESLCGSDSVRDGKWAESIAVGSETFVIAVKETLGDRGERRAVIGNDGGHELRESPAA